MTFPATTRRRVLLGGAALGAGLAAPRLLRAEDAMPELRAAPATAQLTPAEYPPTPVWAYSTGGGAGTVPGPEIRVRAGDRVRYRLRNDLTQATAVHWHGIRIDNRMDGAAPLTQAPVPPGGTFDYDFTAPDPGTYWYHSHDRGFEQVARGLAGPLIVEDREPWLGEEGAATRELTLVVDDWLLSPDATIHEESMGALGLAAHGGRIGNTATVNGRDLPEYPLRPGERVRLRLLNTANARVMPLSLPDLSARLIALDGHPVEPRDGAFVTLAPAQRADVVIDAPRTQGTRAALMVDVGNGEWMEIALFPTTDEAPLRAAPADVRPLPTWSTLPAPVLDGARRATLLMEGGAMRGLSGAMYHGRRMDGQALAAQGMVWALNGVAHGMEAPLFRAARGETVHMALANDTAWAHGIHLHGHHFLVLRRNGAADPHRDVRDTVLVNAGETAEIAFVADNPGQWMIHCHMLEHQEAGMMAFYEVA